MGEVVVDTCAATHAHRMRSGESSLIERLDALLGQPTYLVTNAVRTECVRQGLAEWINLLESVGRLLVRTQRATETRALWLKLRSKHKGQSPGQVDTALLMLAQRNGCRLITDDVALYNAARGEGVACFDLFDVALAAEHLGAFTSDDTAHYFGDLANPYPYYMPQGWKQLSSARWPRDKALLAAGRRSPAVLAHGLFGEVDEDAPADDDATPHDLPLVPVH